VNQPTASPQALQGARKSTLGSCLYNDGRFIVVALVEVPVAGTVRPTAVAPRVQGSTSSMGAARQIPILAERAFRDAPVHPESQFRVAR